MPGITIGDGAVIGTHAVVTKDVEPYSIVAGIPAKEIRKRFDTGTVDSLKKIQWWNWTEDKLQKYGYLFDDPKSLIQMVEKERI